MQPDLVCDLQNYMQRVTINYWAPSGDSDDNHTEFRTRDETPKL